MARMVAAAAVTMPYAAGVAAALVIAPEPLTVLDVQALIARLDAELTERYPNPEDNFFELAEEQVDGRQGVLLVARVDGEPVGCGALRRLGPATGEIKRMYVAPPARGGGIGARILAELERHARELGIRRLLLETGERQVEAVRLYERFGFARVPCFGEYANAPLSLCMGKDLV
jgi:putative acetyltransferase